VGLLFNFNPLIKLDGYYLLSDWLGITNLRRKSFEHWKNSIAGFFCGNRVQVQGITGREKNMYLYFGAFAILFTGFILLRVGIRGFIYFTDCLGGWGFLIFVMVLWIIFRGTIKSNFFKLNKWIFHREEQIMKKTWILRGVFVVVIVLMLCFFRMEQKVGEYCRIYALKHVEIRSPVSGILNDIPVEEGQIVSSGETVAIIDQSEYRNSLEMVSSKIDKLLARKKLLENGPLPEQVEQARIRVDQLDSEIDLKSREKSRKEKLWKEGFISTQEMEQMSAGLEVLHKEKLSAVKELELLSAGSRPELIAELDAELGEYVSRRDYLKKRMEQTHITSTINGIVTTPRRQLTSGKHCDEGDLICEIDDCDTMIVEIPLFEKDISYVKPGNLVLMRVKAYPSYEFEGVVESISPKVSSETNRDKITVRCKVKNPGCILKPNMTGYAKVLCGRKSCGMILAQKVARNIRLEIWSWV
jgi:multidrug resistance efflux pump